MSPIDDIAEIVGDEVPTAFLPKAKERGRALLVFVLIIIGVIVADQVAKEWVRENLMANNVFMDAIPGLIHFVYVENRGAAFGILEGATAYFIVSAIIVTVIATWFILSSGGRNTPELIALSLIVGGAIGNVIDRIRDGFVTDFIAFSFFDFPVFNIADVAVTIGAALFILTLFLRLGRGVPDEQNGERSRTGR